MAAEMAVVVRVVETGEVAMVAVTVEVATVVADDTHPPAQEVVVAGGFAAKTVAEMARVVRVVAETVEVAMVAVTVEVATVVAMEVAMVVAMVVAMGAEVTGAPVEEPVVVGTVDKTEEAWVLAENRAAPQAEECLVVVNEVAEVE